jgi:hypothetical protein
MLSAGFRFLGALGSKRLELAQSIILILLGVLGLIDSSRSKGVFSKCSEWIPAGVRDFCDQARTTVASWRLTGTAIIAFILIEKTSQIYCREAGLFKFNLINSL